MKSTNVGVCSPSVTANLPKIHLSCKTISPQGNLVELISPSSTHVIETAGKLTYFNLWPFAAVL